MTPEPQPNPAETPEPRAERSQGEPSEAPLFTFVQHPSEPWGLAVRSRVDTASENALENWERLLVALRYELDKSELTRGVMGQNYEEELLALRACLAQRTAEADLAVTCAKAFQAEVNSIRAMASVECSAKQKAWDDAEVLRAELAKVRGELEVIKCPTTHQAIVKQIIADRARLEAACLALRTALTDIRDMKEYDQDDQYRLRQIAKQALLITP